jgi:hypothetical protein
MNNLSRHILLLHSITEALAGVIIIMNQGFILNNGNVDSSHLSVAKIYGIASFTIGILSYQIWKKFEYSQFDKMAIIIFVVFHLLIGLQMYSFYQGELVPNPGAGIFHLSLAALLAGAYIKEKNKFL